MKSPIQIEMQSSAPIVLSDRQIILQARIVRVRLPFGGIVWNVPASVSVQMADGHRQSLPVRDVTRLVQVLVLTLGLTGAMMIRLFAPKSIR